MKGGQYQMNNYQKFLHVLSAIEIAARWQIKEPLTVDFVENRITRDRKQAEAALQALVAFDVLAVSEDGPRAVYRWKEQAQ